MVLPAKTIKWMKEEKIEFVLKFCLGSFYLHPNLVI